MRIFCCFLLSFWMLSVFQIENKMYSIGDQLKVLCIWNKFLIIKSQLYFDNFFCSHKIANFFYKVYCYCFDSCFYKSGNFVNPEIFCLIFEVTNLTSEFSILLPFKIKCRF